MFIAIDFGITNTDVVINQNGDDIFYSFPSRSNGPFTWNSTLPSAVDKRKSPRNMAWKKRISSPLLALV